VTSLRLEKAGHARVLRLPDAMPADDASRACVAAELTEACEQLADDDETRVVVVAGSFDVAVAGATREPSPSLAEPLAAVDKPLVAAIAGAAVGQGLELALACDIRLCAEDATFGMPHVTSGLMPSDGGTQRLPRIVGRAHALRMLLTGAPVDAQEAHRIGLVSQVVPAARLMAAAMELAHAIGAKAPVAVRYAKEAIAHGMDMTLTQGLRLEADLYFLLHTTRDRATGIRAFRDKKGAEFEGR
jgi:enoyl-CoA hydratase/carnithine racemase